MHNFTSVSSLCDLPSRSLIWTMFQSQDQKHLPWKAIYWLQITRICVGQWLQRMFVNKSASKAGFPDMTELFQFYCLHFYNMYRSFQWRLHLFSFSLVARDILCTYSHWFQKRWTQLSIFCLMLHFELKVQSSAHRFTQLDNKNNKRLA